MAFKIAAGMSLAIGILLITSSDVSAQSFFDKIKKNINNQVTKPITGYPPSGSKPSQQGNYQQGASAGSLGIQIPPQGSTPPAAGGYHPIDFNPQRPGTQPQPVGGFMPQPGNGHVMLQTEPGYNLAPGGQPGRSYYRSRGQSPKMLSRIKNVQQTSGTDGEQLGRTAPGIPTNPPR
jgi:hypothetical protein